MSAEPLLASRSLGEGVAILIIHGWQMSGEVEAYDFEPVFTHRVGFQRIYIDLPGMGATPIANAQNLDDMYSQVAHFIDRELAGRRFLVVGTSCGAYLARAVCQQYRARVDGLLLRVPLAEPDNSKRDLDPFRALVSSPSATAHLSSRDRDDLGANILLETPEYIAALKKKIELAHRAEDQSNRDAMDRIRNDPMRYRLSNVTAEKFPAPTLILCGRQDEVVGYRDALRLVELYPRASLAVLDRGTHALPLLEWDTFKSLTTDWLDRVLEWKANNKE